MAFYALSTVPLADACAVANLPDVWFADDSSVSGKLKSILEWWNKLCEIGPLYGYYLNSVKLWLVVHQEHLTETRSLFKNTGIQISTESRHVLGAPLGRDSFVEKHVD